MFYPKCYYPRIPNRSQAPAVCLPHRPQDALEGGESTHALSRQMTLASLARLHACSSEVRCPDPRREATHARRHIGHDPSTLIGQGISPVTSDHADWSRS